MIKIHQVHLNGFFHLQAPAFAKGSKLHLQVWRSGDEWSYSPRLHKKACNFWIAGFFFGLIAYWFQSQWYDNENVNLPFISPLHFSTSLLYTKEKNEELLLQGNSKQTILAPFMAKMKRLIMRFSIWT